MKRVSHLAHAQEREEERRKEKKRQRHVVVAAIENRAREVGIAAITLEVDDESFQSGGCIRMHQYIDRQRYHTARSIVNNYFTTQKDDFDEQCAFSDQHYANDKKQALESTLVKAALVLCNAKMESGLNLNSALKEEVGDLQHVEEVMTSRSSFDDSIGSLLLSQLRSRERRSVGNASDSRKYNHAGRMDIEKYNDGKYYLCLAAAAALLSFLESEDYSLSGANITVKYEDLTDFCILDNKAIQGLCLVRSGRNAKRGPIESQSLFHFLGAAMKTSGGKRLLRQNIVQPPRTLVTIEARLEAVEELVENEMVLLDTLKVLTQMPSDVEKVVFGNISALSLSATKSNNKRLSIMIRNLLRLKDALILVDQIPSILSSCQSEILRAVRDVCGDEVLKGLREKISMTIDPCLRAENKNLNNTAQLCFALKSGINGMLDKSRDCFNEITEAINIRASEYRGKYSIPSLKLAYSATKQFYITFKDADTPQEFPEVFQLINVKNSNVHATTQELISLNIRLDQVSSDCLHLTESHLGEIADNVQESFDSLANFSESVCILDMLAGFSSIVASSQGNFSKPLFRENAPLALKDLRHPLIDPLGDRGYVPNNVYISRCKSMIIVHGANMAGKTSYATSIGLCVVMAHIGMFVPATQATMYPTDRILTRISCGDDTQSTSSSFMLEMNDCASIMTNATSDSLVIIDELGRSTSSIEGLCIAWAILEELICKSTPTCVCTHMSLLSHLSNYPFAKNVHIKIIYDSSSDEIRYTHQLEEGRLEEGAHYGIALAKTILPAELVEDAVKMADIFSAAEDRIAHAFQSRDEAQQSDKTLEHTYVNVAQRLEDLSHYYQNMSTDELRNFLLALRSQLVER